MATVELSVHFEYQKSPEEALMFAISHASKVIPNSKLKEASISQSVGLGNSWDIRAIFEKEIPNA